ncbi:phosphate ABC transporter permease subunit PstC [Brevundimonas aveniformis]|uniref:phosphate ABC transporter permease subunit PstC n=1 Tax=Brevundimonas aveniformis TaxID=370977 RepID=UPI00249374C0|nr:phosphate ABC transporter permease subunit PstC [Brevundimonas aveniformis]
MFGLVLICLAVFSAATYGLARRKVLQAAHGTGTRPHSRPKYHGAHAALWAAIPALLVLVGLAVAAPRIITAVTWADLPAAAPSVEPFRSQFQYDAEAIAAGSIPSAVAYSADQRAALAAHADRISALSGMLRLGGLVAVGLAALMGGLYAWSRARPDYRARNAVERWVGGLLFATSAIAVLTTLGIVLSLVWESLRFFQTVSPLEFLTGTHWSPQIAIRADQVGSSGGFGAVPLFVGTFLIMGIAMLTAAPIGLMAAIYLAEYASAFQRAWIKPLLEVLAGIPTVVYGFFAALTVGPAFRAGFNRLGEYLLGGPLNDLGLYLMGVQNQMALVAGVVMGIMLIPFVSSLSDDIINAVPQSLRDGSYAMGATQSETIKRVVLPAALPGVAGAMLLAASRAIGETMIVTMAAGLQARITANPLDSVTTVTVQIVTLLTGDQEFDSPKTLSAFGLGLTLFVVTLILNIVALRIVQHYREQYD